MDATSLAAFWSAMRYNPVPRTAAATTLVFVLAAVLLRHFVRPERRGGRIALRAGVVLLSTVYALTLAEVIVYLFVDESHGSNDTLASRRWFEKHWRPVNALGFRDVEHDTAAPAGRRVLVVLGDSFTAGQGIREVRDRFSDRLAAQLGRHWAVVNLAKPGWDTRDELAALRGLSSTPDAVVLAYYLNDIQGAAAEAGLAAPAFAPPKPRLLRGWINRSYLVNLAWSRWSGLTARDLARDYWAYIRGCYEDERAWAAHRADLLAIAQECAQRRVRLVAMVIPDLQDVRSSRPITRRVVDLLDAAGAEVCDMTDELAGRPVAELVVSPVDGHANERIHAEIAQRLLEILETRKRGNTETRKQ